MEDLKSPAEVSKMFGMSPKKLAQDRREGKGLPFQVRDGRVLYSQAQIEKVLKEKWE
jgi:DNA-binding transcriptional MerR regulator